MIGRAMDFIEAWMEANVKPGDDAEELAGEALAAAQAEGITKAEIEDETGPLAAWIEEAVINPAMPLRILSRLLTTEPRASALVRLGAARDNSQRIMRQWPLQL